MTLIEQLPVEPDAGTDRDGRRLTRADLLAVTGAVLLVAVAAAVGQYMLRGGSRMGLHFPPLLADFHPHRGPGTPFAIAIAVAGVAFGPLIARRLRWKFLLAGGYVAAAAWSFSLAMIDGWQEGVAGRLATRDEYLHDLPSITSVSGFLRGFSSHIVDFRPGSWTTHVSSHPPLATLVFFFLDRVGLRGGGWAGVLVILVGSSAGVAVAVTLRALGAAVAARRALPALVLFPGAVWAGVSADGLFAGVAAWGIALAVLGVRRGGRRGIPVAAAAGLLLGATGYLSYGLALMIFPVIATCALTAWEPSERRTVLLRWGVVVGGFMLVVLVFSAAGFNWLNAVGLLRVRYYQGIAAQRPYWYFLWANLAALCLSAGPMVAAGMARALPAALHAVADKCGGAMRWVSRLGVPRRRSSATVASRPAVPTSLAAALLPAAALLAVLTADLTGLSKAETERIWLPFGIWMVASLGLLPRRAARWALAFQVLVALSINHLMTMNW